MQPFDWQFKDRVSRVVGAYSAHGIKVSLIQHVLDVDVGQVAVGAQVGPLTLKIPREADFLWMATSAGRTFLGNTIEPPEPFISVRFQILRDGRRLQRGQAQAGQDQHWVPLANVSGGVHFSPAGTLQAGGVRPFFWPFPVMLHGGDDLSLELRNDGGQANVIRIQIIGVKVFHNRTFDPSRPTIQIPPPSKPWVAVNGSSRLIERLGHVPDLLPYRFVLSLTIPTVAVPGVETVQEAIDEIEGEGDFYCLSSHVEVVQAGSDIEGYQQKSGGPACWPGKVLITEESGGIRYSNGPVQVGAIFGSHTWPFYWPVPAIWRAGRQIRIEVFERHKDSVDQGAHTARFVFEGFKVLGSTVDLPIDTLLEPRLLETLRIYRELGELGRVEPYFYGFNFDSFEEPLSLRGATRTINVTDGAFAGTYLMGAAFNQTTGHEQFAESGGVGHAGIQFIKNEGKIRYQDRPIEFGSILGDANRMMQLPKPLVLNRNESLACVLTPKARGAPVSEAHDMYVTLAGARILPGVTRFGS